MAETKLATSEERKRGRSREGASSETRRRRGKAVTKSEPSEKATSTDAQPTQVIAELCRSYTSKLEESEQRKQELLAQLATEEQRGHELTKIVRELMPTKKNVNPERQPHHRRSDTSSTRREVLLHGMIEIPIALPKVDSPVESDGVILPWLQWETSNDLQTSPCKTKTQGFLGLKKNTRAFCLDCKRLEKVIGEEFLVILWSQEHLLK